MKIDIFKYLDYRQYLTDLFEMLKKGDKKFSYRSFARMAGSTSPNFFQLIRDRKLNIHEPTVLSISKSLGMNKQEESYFRILVKFDQAKNHVEKDLFFKQILKTRDYRQIRTMDTEHYQFFSHWYIPVIRELATHPDYPGKPGWIAARIEPPVTDKKIIKGISLLEKLGLIKKKKATGKWAQTDKVISTPSEVLSIAVKNYHRNVIKLAGEAIERFKKPQRDIRSVTVGLSEEGFDEVKKRLESFWKELLDFSAGEKNIKKVYQINMQLFPLSKDEDIKE